MAAGFKTATVASAKVAATLTNYPTYVDLSRLGITTLAEAQSVRVYADSSKTTEWARDIVSATEMHVKVPSLTTTTEIYVDWDGVSADYATSATYGRDAVWSDYEYVLHMNEDPSTTSQIDSTGNGQTGAMVGSMTTGDLITGPFAATSAIDFDGIDDGMVISHSTVTAGVYDNYTTAWSTQFWFKGASASWPKIDNFVSTGWLLGNTSDTYLSAHIRNSAAYEDRIAGSVYPVNDNAWHACILQNTTSTARDDFEFYVDGQKDTSTGSDDQLTTQSIVSTADWKFMNTPALGVSAGALDELRVRLGNLSANWITTEYNNQNDEATFWPTWTDAGATNEVKSIAGISNV